MSKFRDNMREARAVLHREMGDGAIIFDSDEMISSPNSFEILNIKVRVHEKFLQNGDLAGTNYHYAEVEDNSPVAVFWLNSPLGFVPKRGMYFLTEYNRGYRVDTVMPADDQTQNAKVIELLPSDMIGWPAYRVV